MSNAANDQPQVPEAVERFVKQLNVTLKAVRLYPPSSSIPKENAADVLSTLRAVFRRQPALRLGVAKDNLVHEGVPVYPGQPAFAAFAREFYHRKLAEVRFHQGVTEAEVLAFLSVLDAAPESLSAAGGFEARLWDAQVDNITVVEVAAKIVDAGQVAKDHPLPPGEPWPPDVVRIDEILASAYGGRPRDQRLLVRIADDPALVARYLKESLAGRGVRPDDAWISGKLVAFAHAARTELPDGQQAVYSSVAEAFMSLDPDLRRRVLADKVLPEARHDESLAGLVRAMGLEEVVRALTAGLAEGRASREGLARAIRNLAAISNAGREEVAGAARAAMSGAGLGKEFVSAVMEDVAPARLRVRERKQGAEDDPVESVLKLVDLAPMGGDAGDDPELEVLRADARRGITDGDVLACLVTVASIDPRPAQFASVMSILEDNLGLLVDRHEFEVARDVAARLLAMQEDERLSQDQRDRVAASVDNMSTSERMHAVTAAMRLYRPDSPEHIACRQLIGLLSSRAVAPLLEALADEPDMAARKAMVDLVSQLAGEHIEELGERIKDRRWYFVRNVVSILAATHSSAAIPYLERTLRHTDSRVRRETVRALAGIRDKRAEAMLVGALADEDAQNVQLAARYLGSLEVSAAVPALVQVAAGEGRGSRELGVRVEAMEALGRIGDREALPALNAIARQRTGLAGRGRELKNAAAAAVAAITVGLGKGGG